MSRRIPYEEKGKGVAELPRPPSIPRVKAPKVDNSELLKKHSLTVIGRVTNPSSQQIWALIPFLADHWKLSSRPVGADLGLGLFQLQFASEQDLLKALEHQPYHFSQWMVILQRWEPTTSKSFPSQIPFWIYVQGIPVHLWSEEILESIAKNVDHEEKDCLTVKDKGTRGVAAKDREEPPVRDTRERRDVSRRRDLREEGSYYSERGVSQEAKSQRSHHREYSREGRASERGQRSHDSIDGYQRISRRGESARSQSHTPSCRNDFPEEEERSRKTQEDVTLPQAEVEVAMEELREVMIQYANCPDPTESAARRERVRLAEEQGEFIQTAEQMVRASLPDQGVTTGLLTPSSEIPSQERIPVAQRLGPLNPAGGVGRGKKRATGKKKLGRPPGKKPSPKASLGVSLKKRKLLSTQPSPYRRLIMENQEVGEASRVPADRLSGSETNTPAEEEAQRETHPVLSWNCQGLGNSMTVRRLEEINKKFRPDVIFLMETKNSDATVLKKLEDLNFAHSWLVSPQGHGGGGLALLWKQELELEVLKSCPNFLDTKITTKGQSFFSSFVYGDPEQSKRRQVWMELTEAALLREAPWFLTGDFNEIVDNSEKEGGPVRAEGTFVDFRSFISECDLYDLKHSGNALSWRGNRGTHVVKCRLDRAMGNSAWTELFPKGRSEYLQFEGSDHRPVISFFDKVKKKKGIFRYDRRLKENEEVKRLVADIWSEDERINIHRRLINVRRALILWNKEKQRNSQKEIEKKKLELEQAMVNPVHDGLLLKRINEELNAAYKEEEAFWKQRSRQHWLQLGDRNTGYFHAATKGRRSMNNMTVLETEEDLAVYEEDQIATVIAHYYQKLFTSSPVEDEELLLTVSEAIRPCISAELNSRLEAIPSAQEIREGLFDINPEKAPGPDGFSASFFHSNWAAIGDEVVNEVQEFFRTGAMPKEFNETHVCLIPKGQGAKKTSDYRPIALCNVYYKIISKVITRRLKPVISDLVAVNQSAFVPRRAISDNVLITHEMLHFLKNSEARKHCSMAVKTDMTKAYDRLEWNFIKAVLTRMGFSDKWIGWMLQCVTTVSYSFLINGSPMGSVTPSRGIRQGDPLSPYIFILCSEVLSGLCLKSQAEGKMVGVRVSRKSPRVNHLLFADDTMFFCRAKEKDCLEFLKILRKYEQASGQLINKHKSSIFFSKRTPPELKTKVKQWLLIEKEGGVGKYLGLPELFGRKKKDLFTSIVDKIRQRALTWSNRFLSGAGKMVLLKSVLSTLPNYAMSCFQLPKSLCKRIQSTLTRFWWDSNDQKKKMCWISWDKLTKTKREGGLAFKDITAFNEALLAKLSWKLINEPMGLLARVLKGKYYHSSDLLNVKCPGSASHGWRSILVGRDLLKKRLGWAIENGRTAKAWSEPWLSMSKVSQPMGPMPFEGKDLLVEELFEQDSVEWDQEKVLSTFPNYAKEILAIKPSRFGAPDRRIWLASSDGNYTTKSGYTIAREEKSDLEDQKENEGCNWLEEVWRTKASPKAKLFLWKALVGAIPTGMQLVSRGMHLDSSCLRCKEPESIYHLLFNCSFAQQVWSLAPLVGLEEMPLFSEVHKGLSWLREKKQLPPSGLAEETLLKAILDAKEWQNAQESVVPSKLIGRGQNQETRVDMPSYVLVNTDAAWNQGAGVAGLGYVFAFSDQTIPQRHAAICAYVSSPLMAECLAIRSALFTALDFGIQFLSLQTDCQVLAKAISAKNLLLEVHGVFSDIFICIAQFKGFICKFVSRAANVEVDALAKATLASYVVNL
ncbi:Endonuclease/exonuclease/phosphatase [Arabidopsis thaliana x Arabidopsis arenosa]|uniref:Endonuclease/exonuclease/phosphatase n=1 Tax=Arabidopsis thaliana x Arabidopsis arenosa TaxID=1240361 RepID=A0A8T1Y8T1_9BRAS|nr:Endonuclease/exonuclease/phosphatase [Arabidopsis thaliana x Arabidopsis arenosa]